MIDLADKCTPDIGFDHRLVDMRRQAAESIDMPSDVIEEVRTPRPHRDDVHQDVLLEVTAVKQMRAQRGGAAEIVRDDGRMREFPVRQHFSEYLALNVERRPFFAAEGLERCRRLLAAKAPEAARRAGQAIERQFLLLETAPDIGRPFTEMPELPELRELVIAFGDSGDVALYRHEPADDAVYVLAFRHQKAAGY